MTEELRMGSRAEKAADKAQREAAGAPQNEVPDGTENGNGNNPREKAAGAPQGSFPDSTRERIAREALLMFSQKGYSAASIRAIAAKVGVKESTIYYHFKSKRDIMDTLIGRVDQIIGGMKARFIAAFNASREISAAAMTAVAEGVLTGYLLNPDVYPLLMTLSIERMQSAEAAGEYARIAFSLPLEQQRMVFREMAERGFIKQGDAQALAEEYWGIIYLAFERHCVGAEGGDIDEAKAQIARGIRLLCEREGIL